MRNEVIGDRPRFRAGRGGIAATLAARPAMAQGVPETADFPFVQTTASMTFAADANRLTLHDVSRTTLFFSDRPERVAGNMTTGSFLPFRSAGKDSVLGDPPNADISILENGTLRQTVVVLEDPVLRNGDLRCAVRIIDGEMPVLGANASVFIHVSGMPLTPLSIAGALRSDDARPGAGDCASPRPLMPLR